MYSVYDDGLWRKSLFSVLGTRLCDIILMQLIYFSRATIHLRMFRDQITFHDLFYSSWNAHINLIRIDYLNNGQVYTLRRQILRVHISYMSSCSVVYVLYNVDHTYIVNSIHSTHKCVLSILWHHRECRLCYLYILSDIIFPTIIARVEIDWLVNFIETELVCCEWQNILNMFG